MRTTICLLGVTLAACTDEPPLVAPEGHKGRAAGPRVCEVVEEAEVERTPERIHEDRRLRPLGPRQPGGGIFEEPDPLDPNDPRDHCALLNRCAMRAVSAGFEWHGQVHDGELVVGYVDDSGTWRSTIVDAAPAAASTYMYPDDDDSVWIRIEERLGSRTYRICVR